MKPARDANARTPAALGYRMPAEWEPHAATWIAWPHERSDWPGKFAPIAWVYGEVVRHLITGESVRILVEDASTEARARAVLRRVGVALDGRGNGSGGDRDGGSAGGGRGAGARVEFFRIPTDRSWTRDTCPIFVRRDRDGDVAITDWKFNGWAKYPNHLRDDAVPARLARRLRLPRFVPMVESPVVTSPTTAADPKAAGPKAARPKTAALAAPGARARVGARPRQVVLEGGSIDVDGQGTLLTTEECLLDSVQARNPGVPRAELERILADHLGVSKVLWLGRGIAGDDTHGHVDDLARFVGPRTVVLAAESNPADANHGPLGENRERLSSMTNAAGDRLQIVPLPMPAPLALDGVRLPASYANFYVGNAAVLVPTFNDPADRQALGILGDLFPDRKVVGIHAVDLVWGLGTLHCMTQQEPAAGPAPASRHGGQGSQDRGR